MKFCPRCPATDSSVGMMAKVRLSGFSQSAAAMALGILPRLTVAVRAAAATVAVNPLLPNERNESNFGFVFIFSFLISDEFLGSGPPSVGGLDTRAGIR